MYILWTNPKVEHLQCDKSQNISDYMQVITNMRAMMSEDSNNAVSTSFLLDDDSRYAINFSRQFNVSFLVLVFAVAFLLKPWIWMQHSFFGGWHFQINAPSRSSRRGSSSVDTWELRIWVLTSTVGVIRVPGDYCIWCSISWLSSGYCTKVQVPSCAYNFVVFTCIVYFSQLRLLTLVCCLG